MNQLNQLPACLRRSIVGAGAALAMAMALATPSLAMANADSKPFPQIANPKVYVIPMKGQLGTDIIKDIYDDIVKDVRKSKPDILVFTLDSSEIDRTPFLDEDDKPAEEQSRPNPQAMRELVLLLRVELGDIPQAIWISDGFGVTSLLALTWPDLYMKDGARFGGIGEIIPRIKKQWDDPDVRAKMVAAWAGIFKGLSEQGGYPEALADAMLYPEAKLSATFEGRLVKFLPDTSGQWVIDSRDDNTASFEADLAEDIGLSDGTAETLEDLVFLLGYREFQKIDTGEKMYNEYVEDWRRAFENAWELYREARRAGSDERAIKKQKSNYDKIISIMKRYPAVETRFQGRGGPGIQDLERAIEQINEQIRSLKGGGRGSSGGGGGGRNAPGSGPGAR